MEMEQGGGEQDQLQVHEGHEKEDRHFSHCSNANGTEEYCPDKDQEEVDDGFLNVL